MSFAGYLLLTAWELLFIGGAAMVVMLTVQSIMTDFTESHVVAAILGAVISCILWFLFVWGLLLVQLAYA